MKIIATKVIVCSPGRNFVTLKIITDEGIYGIGDATLNGREKATLPARDMGVAVSGMALSMRPSSTPSAERFSSAGGVTD